MTVSKQLARAELPNGNTVTAWENWDKYARAPRYEVVVSRKGSPCVGYHDVHKCARTTWKNKFREVLTEESVNIHGFDADSVKF